MAKLPPDIVELEDYTESKNILVYGHTGTGKTVLSGRLPNALFIATENGTISAKRMGSKAKAWPIHHWNDLVKAYEWVANNPDVFEWVIIDSITDMQQKALRGIMQDVVKQNSKRDPDIPAKGDHFKWQLVMKRMITDFNELPVNVLWTAQEMVREDPEGDDIILPLIEGKDYQIASWTCAQMHIVANLSLKRVKVRVKGKVEQRVVRRMICGETPPYFAKDRYNILGTHIDNPDINKIITMIDDSESGRPAKANKPAAKKAAAKKATPRKRTSA